MSRMNPTVRTWVLTIASLVLLVSVIGMVGGFEPRERRAISAEVGELVSVTRWDIAVERCEVEPDDEEGGELWMFVTATNRWTESATGVSSAVVIATPAGERFGGNESLITTTNLDSGGGFDPGFTAAARMRLDFETMWEPDQPVTVTLHDEVNSDGYLLTGRWGVGAPVASVELVCTVITEEDA